MDKVTTIDLSSYPKTKEDWWMWLNHDWDNIINLIKKFTKNKKTINQVIKCKETQNNEIIKHINICWDKIPETESHKDTPGWFVFSELISEIDLLERDQFEQKQENEALFKKRYKHINHN
jgi:hypothetical protein